jgi:hypothetical protein
VPFFKQNENLFLGDGGSVIQEYLAEALSQEELIGKQG